MSYSFSRHHQALETNISSDTFAALLQLSRPLMDYRIVIAITKGDVGAINILKDALAFANPSNGNRVLLTLGPTTPSSLKPPRGTRILWVTFDDGAYLRQGEKCTVVQANNLTDLSLSIEKLSKTRSGRVPLIMGDFLDNVLSVSTAPAGLYAFMCKLFTRIRTNHQTAFLLATEDLHDPKKTAILRRFADAIIYYEAIQDETSLRLKARILDHAENNYSIWDSSESPEADTEYSNRHGLENNVIKFGRQLDPKPRDHVFIPA